MRKNVREEILLVGLQFEGLLADLGRVQLYLHDRLVSERPGEDGVDEVFRLKGVRHGVHAVVIYSYVVDPAAVRAGRADAGHYVIAPLYLMGPGVKTVGLMLPPAARPGDGGLLDAVQVKTQPVISAAADLPVKFKSGIFLERDRPCKIALGAPHLRIGALRAVAGYVVLPVLFPFTGASHAGENEFRIVVLHVVRIRIVLA